MFASFAGDPSKALITFVAPSSFINSKPTPEYLPVVVEFKKCKSSLSK